MKISTDRKEKTTPEGLQNRRGFVLVNPRDKQRSKRIFRIGVSEDLFSEERRTPSGLRGALGDTDDKRHDHSAIERTKTPTRPELFIAFAAAGLILGYFIGRIDPRTVEEKLPSFRV